MRMIIEAHLVDDKGRTKRVQIGAIERRLTADPIGLSFAEGKALLAAAQQHFVKGQCDGISCAHAHCERCGGRLSMKGWHQRQIRPSSAWSVFVALVCVIAGALANAMELRSARSPRWCPAA